MRRKVGLGLVASLAAATLLAVGASTVAGCFGATEIRVELTTNASCAKGIETQLFVGAPGTTDFGTATSADTHACGDAEPRIGTLSVVPSGARDSHFDLEVVAGVGVDASGCRPGHLDGCIIARRRVSFREHQSRRVPVLLSDRCIGVPCGVDESCDLGVCAKLADCSDLGCPRERGEADAGPAPDADAGSDAGSDADAAVAPDAAVGACGPVADTVVDGQDIHGQLAIQGKTLLYVNGSGAGAELRRVPATANASAVGAALPNLVAVTANDTELAYAEVTPDTPAAKGSLVIARQKITDATPAAAGWGSESTAAIAISGIAIVGVTNVPGNVSGSPGFYPFAYSVARPLGDTALEGSVPEIAVDEDGEWYGVAGGATVVHFASAYFALVNSLSGGGPSSDIAVTNRTLYVVLANTPGGPGLHAIPRADLATYTGAPILPTAHPSTLAAAGSELYEIEAGRLVLMGLLPSGRIASIQKLAVVGPSPTALALDADCVYWVEEGKRIMRRARH